MVIAIIGLVLALIWVIFKYITYRRQIKDICRQLEFQKEQETNIMLSSDVKKKEVIRLLQLLDERNETARQERILYQKKDRQLKEALANVSHDIRTPLTSLKGYFQLLRTEKAVEKQREYGDVMEERMNNLTELLEELFAFTRLQNDDYEIELFRCNLTKPILDTLFSFFELFKAQGTEPELDVYDGPVFIQGNELAIKRVVSNLIKNAMVHGKGDLQITYQKSQDGKEIIFQCANTVSNPDEIDVTQVFERFYKADKARSKRSTGLGLAIAKASVIKMRGNIEAALEGNMFRIIVRFPIVE